ncbi:hypothetical protein [Sphingomonas sp. R1]|uniref:hypothetical protein n=1 Tax=Sphingomonas sp. R1 TaxID=399176 RepID=UPI002224C103|nr:hypothetical protein [Sphingomonas sp. R1]UYY78683.1 hypothetical protein OIM94_06780 [Sphingomonas sp. R1]
MAVYGFRGLGWFLCVAVVAPTCYMVNSHGAAERAKLKATQVAIIQAQKDIRGLETEFDTRANMAQIERWNGDVLAMNAPQPQQYLASASGLAALDQPAVATPAAAGGDARVQTAALVIPTGTRPVETASVTPTAPATAKPVATASAAPVTLPAAKAAAATVVRVAARDSKPEEDLGKLMQKVDKARLAKPDRPLLSAATISDLRRVAKREQTAQR